MHSGQVTWTCVEDDLETIAAKAASVGIESLEIPAKPLENESLADDVTVLDAEQGATDPSYAKEVRERVEDQGVSIDMIAFQDYNLLHPEEDIRRKNQEHLKNVIQTADNMDISTVATHIGRDPGKPLQEAIDEAKEVWPELVDFAKSHNVRLAIENAPIDQEFPHGLNLFYNPYAWEELFAEFDSDYFGLNYDPSHLYFLQIDHIEPLERFSDRIFGVHAKDTEIREKRLNELGILTQREMVEDHWWRYRLPGLGEIEWSEFFKALYDVGYDGNVSIEHEDATFAFLYNPGSSPPEDPEELEEAKERFWDGIKIGHREINRYIE